MREAPNIRGRKGTLEAAATRVSEKRKGPERKLKALALALREKSTAIINGRSSNHSSTCKLTPRPASLTIDVRIALENSSARKGLDLN